MKFNEWYKEFLAEDKTGLSDREMLFIAFIAGENSNPVEAMVIRRFVWGDSIYKLIDEYPNKLSENKKFHTNNMAKGRLKAQLHDLGLHTLRKIKEEKPELYYYSNYEKGMFGKGSLELLKSIENYYLQNAL